MLRRGGDRAVVYWGALKVWCDPYTPAWGLGEARPHPASALVTSWAWQSLWGSPAPTLRTVRC